MSSSRKLAGVKLRRWARRNVPSLTERPCQRGSKHAAPCNPLAPKPHLGPCTHLHQRSSCPEAHLGHRLALAPPREPVETGAGAGEGAEGGGTRRDGRVRGARAVGGIIRQAEGPAPGQGVYDLEEGRRCQSWGWVWPRGLLPHPRSHCGEHSCCSTPHPAGPWTAEWVLPQPSAPRAPSPPALCYSTVHPAMLPVQTLAKAQSQVPVFPQEPLIPESILGAFTGASNHHPNPGAPRGPPLLGLAVSPAPPRGAE